MGIKMYNGDAVVDVEPSQRDLMEDAGWSAEEPAVQAEPVEPAEEKSKKAK